MVHDDESSSADGLLRCLSMLADEAAAMNLTRTQAALQAALRACRTETDGSATMLSRTVH